jgi:hypothetical protein
MHGVIMANKGCFHLRLACVVGVPLCRAALPFLPVRRMIDVSIRRMLLVLDVSIRRMLLGGFLSTNAARACSVGHWQWQPAPARSKAAAGSS